MLTMTTCRRLATTAAAGAALGLALLPAAAPAARTPISACGNATAEGVLIDDISARRVSCRTARAIARETPAACGSAGSCTVRGFTCLTARAAPELRFARCSKSHAGDELYRVIRFDFGS
jgi:hypothetical protein